MYLLEKNKRRLEGIALAAGIPLENLRWDRGPVPDRPGPPTSLRDADILIETQTGYIFCFGHRAKDGPLYVARPSGAELSSEGAFPDVVQIEPIFKSWAEQVSIEREAVISWPEPSEGDCAISTLLHSERTALLRTLYRYDFDPSEFKWGRMHPAGVVLQRPRNNFQLRLARKGNQFEFRIRPSTNDTDREGNGLPSSQLPALFDEWVAAMRSEDQAQTYSHEAAAEKRHLQIRLTSLTLENIRGFKKLEWKCDSNNQNTLLIIGQNGTGKTTLLRCLALLLVPRQIASSLLISPYCGLLRRGEKEGKVLATFFSGDQPLEASMTIGLKEETEEISSHWSDDDSEFRETVRVYAYGIGRSFDAEGGPPKDPKVQAINSLFHYNQPLVSPENLLLKIQAADHMYRSSGQGALENTLKRSLKDLLQLGENFEFDLKPGKGLFLITGNGRLPLANWADGYRLSLMWILDLWNSALTFGDLRPTNDPLLSSPQGLLLIDEIEQHAHPRLQLNQILGVERALPNLFRVITTHSPLVTLGVNPAGVLVLKADGDEVRSVQAPDYSRFTIDEVYRDTRLFSTEPQSHESEEKLKRWKELIEIPWEKRTEGDQAEIDELSSWFANE